MMVNVFARVRGYPYPGRDTVRGVGKVSLIGRPSEFHHFDIALSKDTLKNQEVSNVRLTAVDREGNEVTLEGSTPINLSFDEGGEFADFISVIGDTVNSLSGIPYDTLRLNGISVVARGTVSTPPPVIVASLSSVFSNGSVSSADTTMFRTDFPRTILRAVSSADATKVGIKNVIMKPEINVIASDSVKPYYPGVIDTSESRVNVKVAVTVSGILYTALPYRVNLRSLPIDGSGGHDHTANRPSGYFLNGRNDTLRTQEFETGPDTIRTRYQPSMFGGEESIIASLVLSPPAITGADTVVVRVPRLVLLPQGTNYTKVGGTCNHHGSSDQLASNSPCQTPDNNHHVSREVIDSLVAIANAWNQAFPTQNRLMINDIGLPNGGAFDINGNWERDIAPGSVGHETHRLGRSVDIRTAFRNVRSGVNIRNRSGTVTRDERGRVIGNIDFNDICSDRSATARIHGEIETTGEHYHLDF